MKKVLLLLVLPLLLLSACRHKSLPGAEAALWKDVDSITSSIILPGNRIITRNFERHCSDAVESDGPLHCTRVFTTTPFAYDEQLERFVIAGKPVKRIEDN